MKKRNIMFRKSFILVVFLAIVVNHTVFSQVVTIDAAISNAVRQFIDSGRFSKGTTVAVLNMSSDNKNLSDYIINEIIASMTNTGIFEVVPRSTVEIELADMEHKYDMSGFVDDEYIKDMTKNLSSDIIISGTITRESTESYRLIINAIHRVRFVYLVSYRGSVRDDKQMQTIVAGSKIYENFTTKERLMFGTLNIIPGLGSAIQKDKLWWINTIIGGTGIFLLVQGIVMPAIIDDVPEVKVNVITGAAIYGVSVIYGFARPFFVHKPKDSGISLIDPTAWNIELVSANKKDINGFRISYNMRF